MMSLVGSLQSLLLPGAHPRDADSRSGDFSAPPFLDPARFPDPDRSG
jgi:hypothetical protein